VTISLLPLLISLAVSPDALDASVSPGQALAGRALHMPEGERMRALAALPLAEKEAFFRSLSVAVFVALGRRSLDRLGVYQARVTRVERVADRVQGPDTVEVTVRERPRAVLLEFVTGIHKGRRALYNADLRPTEMLARESGLLGLVSVWLALDSRLTHRYSNHNITEVGFGAMIDTMHGEHARAAAAGGYDRHDEGFDARGLYCMVFTAPASAKGLYARRLRYCVEGELGLPMKIEVFDDKGRREYVEYENLRVRQLVSADFFTPGAAGL
jgi:hypothetical protein